MEDTQVDSAVEEVEVIDTLATQEIKQEVPRPQLHEGVIAATEFISGVGQQTGNNYYGISLSLLSETLEKEEKLTVFFPRMFAEKFAEVQSEQINVKDDFPEEDGNKQRTSYARGIANSDKTAALQRWRKIALAEGRTMPENPPTTIEEFVELHGDLLQSIPVVFLMRTDSNPNQSIEFKYKLKAQNIFPMSVKDDEKTLARWRKAGYRLMWEG